MSWPPTLADLKTEMAIATTDTRADANLTTALNAAIDFVERVRGGAFQFDPNDPAQFSLTPPTGDITLGTLRLARRWHERRRSPDGMVSIAPDMGSNRVPSFDADIDRLLGIGRHRGSVVA